MMLKSVEIFSGCGGLAKGLEKAGFRHCAFVENNKWACQSLRLNFQPRLVHETDIRTFNFSQYDGVDLVAGGPPCQPFSPGGLARAYEDERDMFPQAARAVRELRPKAFVFENVKGLLRKSFQEYFEYIILRMTFPDEVQRNGGCWREHFRYLATIDFRTYKGLKYRVHFKLLNAADYGVPQIRERVFIVGLKSDVSSEWFWPPPTVPVAARRTVFDAIGHLPQPQSKHTLDDHLFIDGARSYQGHTGSDIHKPGKTIKAGAHGVPGGENMLRFPDGSVRYMTVREAKLIQTFPPDYKISGRWGEALRQIGNAVPVKLAEIIGRRVASLLQNEVMPDFQNGFVPPATTSYETRDRLPAGQLVLFEPQGLYLVHKTPVTLLGTYRKTCRDWIVSNNLYNYPVSDDEIKSCRPLFSVRRLVLKRKNDAPLHFKVRDHDIVGKKELLKLGYRTGGRHPASQKYILYKLSPMEAVPPYDEKYARQIVGKGVGKDHQST